MRWLFRFLQTTFSTLKLLRINWEMPWKSVVTITILLYDYSTSVCLIIIIVTTIRKFISRTVSIDTYQTRLRLQMEGDNGYLYYLRDRWKLRNRYRSFVCVFVCSPETTKLAYKARQKAAPYNLLLMTHQWFKLIL